MPLTETQSTCETIDTSCIYTYHSPLSQHSDFYGLRSRFYQSQRHRLVPKTLPMTKARNNRPQQRGRTNSDSVVILDLVTKASTKLAGRLAIEPDCAYD